MHKFLNRIPHLLPMNRFPDLRSILLNTFESLLTEFIDFVPKLIASLVILIVGVVVGKVMAKVVEKVLHQIGFDAIGDRINQIEAIKKFNVTIKLSYLVSQILYYFINLVFLIAATATLGVPAIANMVTLLVAFIPKVLSAAIMMLAGVVLADTVRKFVVGLCLSFNISSAKVVGSGVFFFLFIIAVIASLSQAGINTSLLESSFNLIIGGFILAFSIGYGFPSKEILLNILSAMYLKKKYQVGQEIQVGEQRGHIIQIDQTSLTLQQGEQQVVVPMHLLQKEPVIVFSS